MLVLQTNATGSKANSYNLICNDEILFIDFGLPYKDMLLTIDNIDNVVGGLLSHYH